MQFKSSKGQQALLLLTLTATSFCIPLLSESQQASSPEGPPPILLTPQGECPDLGCGPCQPAPDRTDVYPCVPCNRTDLSCLEVPATATAIPSYPPTVTGVPEVPPTSTPECVKVSFSNKTQVAARSTRRLPIDEVFPPKPSALPSCLAAAIDESRDYFNYIASPSPSRPGTDAESWRRGCVRHCDYLANRNELPGKGKQKGTESQVQIQQKRCISDCSTVTSRYWAIGADTWGWPQYNKNICDATCARLERYWADDQTVVDFISRFGGIKTSPSSTLRCTNYCDARFANCGHYPNMCIAGEYYLDKQCAVLPKEMAAHCTQSYSTTFEPSSPISLMWGDRKRIDAMGSLVRFTLDLSSNEAWSVWYGSAATPLLVHDPARTRRVTSATQLFGNWSFGGKHFAALQSAQASESAAGNQATPWSNGYEALATLDADGDGFIRDGELSDLALWFDTNRDAQSQPGEIVDIRESGVTSLSLGPTKSDPATRHIEVTNGYTRIVEDREVTGASVDWYGDSAETMQQLAIEQRMKDSSDTASLDELLPQKSSYGANPSNVTDPDPNLGYDGKVDSKITGFWSWRAEIDPVDSANRGTLVMRELKNGNLEILSLTESPMKDSAARVSGVISFQFMTGSTKAGGPGGKPELAFSSLATSKAGNSGEPLITSQGFLQDENTIIGKTTEVIRLTGESQKIEYGWIATRTLPLQ